jgi:hypothetical protein
MNLISVEEKIQLLKNLLSDPDDWVSRQILELASIDNEKQDQDSNPVQRVLPPK